MNQVGRHLLYLDLLGFKELIKRNTAHHVYTVLDRMLAEFTLRGKRISDQFKTIYFSDTVVFYQADNQWGLWAFLDSYAIGAMAWSTLAALGIPSRGAIAFGEFHVEPASSGLHDAFWGPALIEAYETESDDLHRNWIGLTICRSVQQAIDSMEHGLIEVYAQEGRWYKEVDGTLLLNPFMKLAGVYQDELLGEIEGPIGLWNAPDFSSEVKALLFIKTAAEGTNDQGPLPDAIRNKYIYTYSRLAKMLTPDLISWTIEVAERMDDEHLEIE